MAHNQTTPCCGEWVPSSAVKHHTEEEMGATVPAQMFHRFEHSEIK